MRGRDRNAWRNWGRNQRCAPAAVEQPESEFEVVEAVGRAIAAGQTLKVAGSGHSFTDIACTEGRLLLLDRLDRLVAVDHDALTATVEGGIPLWKLNEELARRGLALASLGDIDRQTISGAIATATHGTGMRFGGLASFVVGLELVTGDGSVVRCSADEEPEIFACARVNLGALGVITKVTLQCAPAFRLHSLERPITLETLLAEFDAAADANDHVDAYWWPHTEVATIKVNNRADEPIRVKRPYQAWRDEVLLANWVFGAVCRLGQLRPSLVPELMRTTARSLGKTEIIDESHRVFCSRRLVRFVEMEYAVPRADAAKALLRIRDLIEREGLRVDFPVELRATGADDIPLSTAYGRDTAYLAVHLSAGTPFEPYFRGVEGIMDDVGGRPHWGKMHFQTAETLAPRYPGWERFRAVRARLDPRGRFRNPYLDRVLGAP
jgi:FAD-linked oxidoreductase